MVGGSRPKGGASLTDAPHIAPLAVLAEGWPLRDALILTFNANLGFFERAALTRLRARGARVTLVSDADVVHADPDAVRFAGRSYLDGRSVCRSGGAFHPKLIITVSADQAAVLVGSGNASPGGWMTNAEIWTLLRATAEEGAPAALARIADFLDGLPAAVRFTPGVEEVLVDVAAALRVFRGTDAGPLTVSSLWGPIIDQIPAQPATEHLLIAAPFHDRDAAATRALFDRLNPAAVEVLVQPETIFDGARMAGTLEALGGTVATIADQRYHHGKLIEWRTAQGAVSLTGSPNCSRSALLWGMSSGGNCELGLLETLSASLRPETGESEPPAAVVERSWKDPVAASGQAVVALLAVILDPTGLRVVLRSPLDEPTSIQHLTEGRWEPLDIIPAGVEEHTSAIRIPGASALRLMYADGAPSNVVWVTDLLRTGFRSLPAKHKLPNDPVKLALDPHLVTMVEQALATVRAWSADIGGPTPSATPPYTARAQEDWREYIDSFRVDVGDDFSFFVLPHLMRAAGAAPPSEPETEPGVERGDDDESGRNQDGEEEDITIRLAALRGSDRMAARLASYRRMCERLAEDPSHRPRPVLIAGAILSVGGAAMGCWGDQIALSAHLRRSLRALAPLADDEDLRIDAANIAAVGLAVLRSQVREIGTGDELTTTFLAACREVRPLLPYATETGVAERTAGLVDAVFGSSVTIQRVMEIVGSTTNPDHLAQAAERLADEYGLASEVDGTCIRISTAVPGDPVAAVLRAIGLAQDADVVGAVASGPKGTAAAVWRTPHVVVARRIPTVRRVTHYKLDYWSSPNDFARTEGRIPADLEQGNWYGEDALPDWVEELLLEGGMLLEEI